MCTAALLFISSFTFSCCSVFDFILFLLFSEFNFHARFSLYFIFILIFILFLLDLLSSIGFHSPSYFTLLCYLHSMSFLGDAHGVWQSETPSASHTGCSVHSPVWYHNCECIYSTAAVANMMLMLHSWCRPGVAVQPLWSRNMITLWQTATSWHFVLGNG